MEKKEENAVVVDLFGGSMEVELSEFWACEGDVFPCSVSGSYIDVIDTENNSTLCTIYGSLPDEDDEDYDEEMKRLIEKIENEL